MKLEQYSQQQNEHEGLAIIIIGASGDLASKKIYPSLFSLYRSNLIPVKLTIWGYARSNKTHESFRFKLKPHLLTSCKTQREKSLLDSFLSKCFYQSGESYGHLHAYRRMIAYIQEFEDEVIHYGASSCNRLFYFSIPPNVFGEAGLAVKEACMSHRGWNRIIVEKPFGRDLESCIQLSNVLSTIFSESQLYRIDHYLGKEMVQNILMLRFSNIWIERIWNRNVIDSVLIEFKESIGTEGRGGYFDHYGIIRDVIQNHLVQILTLLTMECPIKLEGPGAEEAIRDAKVRILNSIPPIKIEDCVLGQYEGYNLDSSIKNKNTKAATYAALKCYVNSPRWQGVPFILTAGKALDEKKVEIRAKLKNASTLSGQFLPSSSYISRNEFVISLQPSKSISIQTNVNSPTLPSKPICSSLFLDYDVLLPNQNQNLDAYARLLLDALNGIRGSFVRDDELLRSWEIFTPILHHIENKHISPFVYSKGANGPKEAQEFVSIALNERTSTSIPKATLLRSSL